MKDNILFYKLLPILLLMALPAASQPQDYTYTTNNGAITIAKYTGPGGDVIIPDTISGLPVTIIDGFGSCSNLTSVVIPNTVTNIDNVEFEFCICLTSITVDKSNPVYSSLDGVLFDKSQTSLIHCPRGKSGYYKIPDSVTSIWDSAFRTCVNLSCIEMSEGVTDLDGYASFADCTRLSRVKISPSITRFGDNMFGCCTSLASILLPNSITNIGYGAFRHCTSLTNVTISANATTIGAYAFDNCISLKNIIVPASVSHFGDYAFRSCTNLTKVCFLGDAPSLGETFGGRPTKLWEPEEKDKE